MQSLYKKLIQIQFLSSSVAISHEEWCWKQKSVEVEVMDSNVEGVEFRQTGYMLRCSLSHAITLVSKKHFWEIVLTVGISN